MDKFLHCKWCGEIFEKSHSHVRYCSLVCSIKANKEVTQTSYRKMVSKKLRLEKDPKICPQCLSEFLPRAKSNQRFCCKACNKAYERLSWARAAKH